MLLNLLTIFAGETYRLFVEISPYLILGFFFAGLIHTVLGEDVIKKHFARSGFVATLKAAIFGIPLPICSCGVIPLAETLRRDGASKSSTMTFLVSTPSSGVDSIFATYALMGPVYAVFRPIASFFSGIIVGFVTHLGGGRRENLDAHHQPQTQRDRQSEPASDNVKVSPKKTFRSAITYGFQVIPSEIAKWLVIGVVAGGAISALVPADFGARYLDHHVLNYAVILVISIPVYVCATGSIPIAAALITKGVLPGAALAFLIAGPATNTVTMSFVWKRMGAKLTILYILSITATAVGFGLLFDLFWTPTPRDMEFISSGGEFIPASLKIISAIAMVVILINSKFNLGRYLNMSKEKENVHKIKIPDMTCQHCKMTITKSLEELPGVRSIRIDLVSKEADIEVEPGLDRQKVLEKIKSEGYHPEE